MEIKVRTMETICELTVEGYNSKISEDVALFASPNKFEVSYNQIENVFSAGFELSRFNKKSDVETLKMLFDAFLNDSEKTEFLELIQEA